MRVLTCVIIRVLESWYMCWSHGTCVVSCYMGVMRGLMVFGCRART